MTDITLDIPKALPKEFVELEVRKLVNELLTEKEMFLITVKRLCLKKTNIKEFEKIREDIWKEWIKKHPVE